MTIDPPSLATLVGADISVTVLDAKVGDEVNVSYASATPLAGIIITGVRVTAQDTVLLRVQNVSAGTVDQTPIDVVVVCTRQ